MDKPKWVKEQKKQYYNCYYYFPFHILYFSNLWLSFIHKSRGNSHCVLMISLESDYENERWKFADCRKKQSILLGQVWSPANRKLPVNSL
jgi:hypothetical protein